MTRTINGKEKRSFKVVEVRGKNGQVDKQASKVAGEFELTGTHGSAARKAGNKLCRYKKIKGACVWYVSVRESTQGSGDVVRKYKVIRHKLKVPVVLAKGTKDERRIEFETKAFAVKGSIKANYNKTKRSLTSAKGKKTKKNKRKL